MLMEAFVKDARHAVSALLRNPAFTVVALLTLGLGLGATATVASLVSNVLLRPVPFPRSEELMSLEATVITGENNPASWPNFEDWKQQDASFSGLAGYVEGGSINLQDVVNPERVPVVRVTANLFTVLGAQPRAGRLFVESEDKLGSPSVAVLGESLWRHRFRSDPTLIGKSITLDGQLYTVVGILPERFEFPAYRTNAVWVPIQPKGKLFDSRTMHFLSVIGRLKLGVTPAAAQAEMATIAQRLAQIYPLDQEPDRSIRVTPLKESLVGEYRYRLLLVFGAVGLVLLIACFNVTNLLLAQAAARRREFAIRVAIGAGRPRLFRQLLTENLVLAFLGCTLGVALAFAFINTVYSFAVDYLPSTPYVGLAGYAVLCVFLIGIVFTLGAGLAPAYYATRLQSGDLRDSSPATGLSPSRLRVRNIFVSGELALSLMLLFGAGVLLKTLWNLEKQDTGMRLDHILTFKVSVGEARYKDRNIAAMFYQPLLEELRNIPGVASVGLVNLVPLETSHFTVNVDPSNHSMFQNGSEWIMEFRIVSPGYYTTMGIPLLRGRDYSDHDTLSTPPVAIINDVAASTYFNGSDPVGQQVMLGKSGPEFTIVGITKGNKQDSITKESKPEIDIDYAQVASNSLLYSMTMPHGIALMVRSKGDPNRLREATTDAVHTLDANQPIYDVSTMSDVVKDSMEGETFGLLLLAVFAGIAITLACAGVYGLVSWSVAQRTREIGLRMALGASRGKVAGMMLSQSMRLLVVGLAFGAVGAISLGGVLRSMLFGVKAWDTTVLLGATLLLSGTSLIASLIPACRAALVDPIDALRDS
jgi:putative ABC transport system permease protein